jgi:hypothetical protein
MLNIYIRNRHEQIISEQKESPSLFELDESIIDLDIEQVAKKVSKKEYLNLKQQNY